MLETLLDVTEKVQIHNITDSSYSIIKYFLHLFISIGKVKHGTFNVTGKLALNNVNDLFQVCAGIQKFTNAHVSCFCDTLSDLNSDCDFLKSSDLQHKSTDESDQESTQEEFKRFIRDQEDVKMADCPVNSNKILVGPDCDVVEKYMDGIEDTFDDVCSNHGNCDNDVKPEEIDLFKEALTPLINELLPDKNSNIPGGSVHKFLSSGKSNILDSVHSACGTALQKRKRPYPFTTQGKVICIKGIKQLNLQQNGKISEGKLTLSPRSLTSLLCVNSSVIKSSEHSKGICTAIAQVLPNWTSLKQIGIFNTGKE